jgi:glycine cleavage system H protein
MEYSKEHVWILNDKLGITDYAIKQFKEIVYIDLPPIGKKIKIGDILLTLETVKAVTDIISPVEGKVLQINKFLEEDPNLKSDTWVLKMEITKKNTITQQEYEKIAKLD